MLFPPFPLHTIYLNCDFFFKFFYRIWGCNGHLQLVDSLMLHTLHYLFSLGQFGCNVVTGLECFFFNIFVPDIQSIFFYFSDTFNENSPPTNDPEYISNLGAAVYKGISKGDKDAVWLMQVCFSWLGIFWFPFWFLVYHVFSNSNFIRISIPETAALKCAYKV